MNTPLSDAMQRRMHFISKTAGKGEASILDYLWKGLRGKNVFNLAKGRLPMRAYRAGKGVHGAGKSIGGAVKSGGRFLKEHPKLTAGVLSIPAAEVARRKANAYYDNQPDVDSPVTEDDINRYEERKLEHALAKKQGKVKKKEEPKTTDAKTDDKKKGDSWIPGIDDTLTAGAGGGVAGATGGYFLGKHMGWDPITSSLVGGLGTATAAAMLAHHLRATAEAKKAEGK